MKPLSMRVLELLPGVPDGLTLGAAAKKLSQDVAHVRKAFAALAEHGEAKIVRRGRGGALYLFSLASPIRACAICQREILAKRKETKTCSHSCGRHLAWQNENMRARHQKSVKRAALRPERRAKMQKISKEFSNRPEEIARRSESNRRSWADPEERAKRVLAIKDAWKGDGATRRKAKAREQKLSLWNDPTWRAKTVNAMRTGKRGRFKRAMIALVELQPEMDETTIAHEVGITPKQLKLLMRRAYQNGEISRQPEDGRKQRQPAEQITNRVAAIARARARLRRASEGAVA